MARKPLWTVRRSSDNRVLCWDGRWRLKASGYEEIKLYKSLGWLERFMDRHGICEWTATAVYPGDTLDCCGNVMKGE
jgi:hypothetical protein